MKVEDHEKEEGKKKGSKGEEEDKGLIRQKEGKKILENRVKEMGPKN